MWETILQEKNFVFAIVSIPILFSAAVEPYSLPILFFITK